MYLVKLTPSIMTIALLALPISSAYAQSIYKWTDASGQVHYGAKKPESTQAQTLDIAPSPTAPGQSDNAAEIARLNALAEQMAQERRVVEQARQEQATRDLEQENQQLKNELLKKELEKKQQDNYTNPVIIGSPPPYLPYPPYPPPPHPCEPWPRCHKPPLPPPPLDTPTQPLAKPNPPFKPNSIGIDSASQGVFRGR